MSVNPESKNWGNPQPILGIEPIGILRKDSGDSSSSSKSRRSSPPGSPQERRRRRRHSSFSISYSAIIGGLNRKQWSILVILGCVELTYCLILLNQGVFFPPEAKSKGVQHSLFGFVFGLYDLSMFFMALVWGKHIEKIGPKYAYIFGLFLTGICSILFGFLHFIDDSTLFSLGAFLLRIIEGIGDAGFQTASFTIIVLQFPEHTGTTFAALQGVFGCGFIIGPVIVGFLFESLGGFPIPFIFTGSIMLLLGAICIYLLPLSLNDGPREISQGKKSGFRALLKIPAVALDCLSIIPTSISIGFLETTLESHISQFNLGAIYTSIIYSIYGIMYAISSPIWGWICDRVEEKKWITFIGSLFVILAFCLIGPAPFIPISQPLIWLTCIGLFFHGIGVGGTFISAFLQALGDARNNGFPDDINTYGIVSGLWKSFLSFGNFIGPSIAGILYDAVGFRNEAYFVISSELLITILSGYFILKKYLHSSPIEINNFEDEEVDSFSEDSAPSISSKEHEALIKDTKFKGRRVSFDENQLQYVVTAISSKYGSI